jgi:hypothetical protein
MVSTSCGHPFCRRDSGHLGDHLGSGPFDLCHRAACRDRGRRSGLDCGLYFDPYRHGDGLVDLGRRLFGACCVCRRSHSRGCRACDRLGEGAHRTSRSGRVGVGRDLLLCCFVVVVWPEVRRSLTRKRGTICVCEVAVGSLDCGEHYIMR